MTFREVHGRLAFSFLIVAFALFWMGQQRIREGDRSLGPQLQIAGAIVCVGLGVAGLKARHGRR